VRDLALLILRLTVGGMLAGHGAQKLFGAFGGPGLRSTAGWLESLGLRPGKPWALAAGASGWVTACSPPWACSSQSVRSPCLRR